jgi:hypothetical protein
VRGGVVHGHLVAAVALAGEQGQVGLAQRVRGGGRPVERQHPDARREQRRSAAGHRVRRPNRVDEPLAELDRVLRAAAQEHRELVAADPHQ